MEPAEAFSDRVAIDSRVREVARPWTNGDYKSVARHWLSGKPVERWEPRDEVLERMRQAVEEALKGADGPVVVVTHGMVMSDYIASVADLDPISFWSDLGFPDVRYLDLDQAQVRVPENLSS
jgi:broad specificity phosphatase PhoE